MEQFEIIYKDEAILVANKLSPLPVLPDPTQDPDLKSLLAAAGHGGKSPRGFLEAAHRIDRRTSGIVIFARNPVALERLEKDFRERKVSKTYIACLEKDPAPPEGRLKHLIRTDPKTNRSVALPMSADGAARGVIAELAYRRVLATDRYFFVEAKPLTGRHHQIRAQFAAMGWPIKGDLKYGSRRGSISGRIMLHAWKVEFTHPATHETLSLEARLPDDETLWKVFEANSRAQGTDPIA